MTMGVLASYYALTDEQIAQLRATLSDFADDGVIRCMDFISAFDDTEHYANLDKLWDGLHFLLTSFGRANNQLDNKTSAQIALYQGFFGQETLASEFVVSMSICLLDKSKVADVVLALDGADIDGLLADVDFLDFDRTDIYPKFWANLDNKADMCAMLKDCFNELKHFYHNALKNGHSVLVIIG